MAHEDFEKNFKQKRVSFQNTAPVVISDPVYVDDSQKSSNKEFAIPEISDLWWNDVDDGEASEPQNQLE